MISILAKDENGETCADRKLKGVPYGENWRKQYFKCVNCQSNIFVQQVKCGDIEAKKVVENFGA